MDNTNDFEKECTYKFRQKKPKERASCIIRCYYDTVQQNGEHKLTGGDAERTAALNDKFSRWLYGIANMDQKIKAIEEYYFEMAPAETDILRDILERMRKMYVIFGEHIERTELK